ncbi:MAG: DinB family protein [Massilia sp.]
MQAVEQLRLMASYNALMNERIYGAARSLPPERVTADRKAFFGSLLGTLQHLVNADTIWLQRFANHPAGFGALAPVLALSTPAALNAQAFTDIDSMWRRRRQLDEVITAFTAALQPEHLDDHLAYSSMKGIPFNKPFFGVLLHFFNHQTHHRGQATTLLSQEGADVGVTDLLTLIPDEEN